MTGGKGQTGSSGGGLGCGGNWGRGFKNSSLIVVSFRREGSFQMVDVMVPGVNRLFVLKHLVVEIFPFDCVLYGEGGP